MTDEKFGYALDRQAESWDQAEGDTREDAAAYAFAMEPDATEVYICEQRVGDKAALFDVDEFLEHAEEVASESEHFSHYEDSVFDYSPQARAHFRADLDNAIRLWLEAYPGPRIWTIRAGEITKHERQQAKGR